MIFIDTPGIHKPKGLLNEYMVKTAKDACEEVDIVLFVAEADRQPGEAEEEITGFIRGLKNNKIFLVINKIDLVKKDTLLPLMNKYSSMYSFAEIIPVSSLKGANLPDLMKAIIDNLPEGPQYYPKTR